MLSSKQLNILQHSLGCDQYGRGTCYRKHFAAGPSGEDRQTCEELATLGCMTNGGQRPAIFGDLTIFYVTDAGVEAMRRESPPPPPAVKLTPSQQRYREYLRAETSCSFKEWLGIKPKEQLHGAHH